MIEALEDALDINFRDDLGIEYVNIESYNSGKRFRKEGDVLHLNLRAFDEEELEALSELPPAHFDQEERILRHSEEQETRSMEDGYDEDDHEILSYFEGVLTERYLSIIERSLHLRAVIEEKGLSKDRIREKKGQIARQHGGPIAIYLCSLVNAGYFDPDGGLRDLYVDLGLNPEYNRHNFQSILTEYAENELICVFIKNDQSAREATNDVRGGLKRYQREQPIQEWFDVRGVGEGCEEIIDGVMRNLEDELMGLDYDRWAPDHHIWVRIYPGSLEQLPE